MLVIIHLVAIRAGAATPGTADIRRVSVHQLGAREGIGAEEGQRITHEQPVARGSYHQVRAGVIAMVVYATDVCTLAMHPERTSCVIAMVGCVAGHACMAMRPEPLCGVLGAGVSAAGVIVRTWCAVGVRTLAILQACTHHLHGLVVEVETDIHVCRALVEQESAMAKEGLNVRRVRRHQVDELLVDASASLATTVAACGT